MDPRLLRLYNRELQHLREMGSEFAQEFPKVAGRLGMEGLECADPYVERLLEGFAFLTARVQLKLEAEFPSLTQHLLETTMPHYLAPTPSMAVVQFRPDLGEAALTEGVVLPRGTVLRSNLGKGDQTACDYRTAHATTLWPLQIDEARYYAYARDLPTLGVPDIAGAKAALRLRLATAGTLPFESIDLDRLPLYLRSAGEKPMRLYEQCLANCLAVVARPPADGRARSAQRSPWRQVLDRSTLSAAGLSDDEALLPYGPRSFQGYRLLHEYFAFPERFMFLELTGLLPVVKRCKESQLDLILILDRSDGNLENAVSADDFALFCTPAINLFPKRADRIHLDDQAFEYHVVPDRTRPMDFEVYTVNGVTGYGSGPDSEQAFLPFYATRDSFQAPDGDTQEHTDGSQTTDPRAAYYSLRRQPRMLSPRQQVRGPRSSYVGSETYVAIVDANQAPFRSDLRQLGVATLCTNRDLPLHMPIGVGRTDFSLEASAPVESVHCVSGPTKPKPSHVHGEIAWRLISHLSLNYLSLADENEKEGARALRELLGLYADLGDAAVRKQIEGVRSVVARPVVRRLPTPGPLCFGRGLQVTLLVDEADFEGSGVFLLGSVLERFFARYVSLNSFSETVLRTVARGEIIRWPARTGQRQVL